MKTVLITGGTRGIGLACVEKFSAEGWRVALLYKNSDTLATELSERLNVLCVKCDVSFSRDIKKAIGIIIEKFGCIDVLVNNAGISHTGLIQYMSDDEWDDVLGTNLSSVSQSKDFRYC